MNQPPHILDAASHADPYPYYAALRAGPALVFDAAHGLWVAASAAAVQAVLEDSACVVRPPAQLVPPAIVGTAAGELFGHLVRMNEGAGHTRPKFVLERLLAGVDLAPLRGDARRLASRGLASPGNLRGEALTRWTLGVPVMVVAGWLGFSDEALPQVAAWTGDFAAALSPLSSTAQLASASVAAQALLARMADLVRAAGVRPGSPLAHIQQQADEAGWTNADALLANLVGLLSQTYEATAGLIGNGVVALSRQTGPQPARAPGQWLAFVHEVSRHDPSVQNTRRYLAKATDIAGVQLAEDDTVLLVLAAAGRDALVHAQADEFRPDRPVPAVPGFGQGRHQCPGQALACAIAASALQAWHETGAPLPLRWRYRPSVNARIPEFLD